MSSIFFLCGLSLSLSLSLTIVTFLYFERPFMMPKMCVRRHQLFYDSHTNVSFLLFQRLNIVSKIFSTPLFSENGVEKNGPMIKLIFYPFFLLHCIKLTLGRWKKFSSSFCSVVSLLHCRVGTSEENNWKRFGRSFILNQKRSYSISTKEILHLQQVSSLVEHEVLVSTPAGRRHGKPWFMERRKRNRSNKPN